MSDILYVSECSGICGEQVGSSSPQPAACWPCTPHVCLRELPEDDWCDLCGRDL